MKQIKDILILLIRPLYKILRIFYKLEIKKIIFFILLIPLILVMLWLIIGTLTGGWLHQFQFKKLQSLEKRADKVYTFDTKRLSKFSEFFPFQQYSVLLDKIIVNLKPEKGHPTPMGAFQIYLKVDSRKTAIFIKKIKQKIHDKLQREIEELTYNEIQGIKGMKKIKSVIKNTTNDVLSSSQGKVHSVYFKTIITKP